MDDYIVKPFSPTELVARIQEALRRRAAQERVGSRRKPYVLGDLTIDIAQRRVTVAGQQVWLTAIQCDPLAELAVNAGRVVPTSTCCTEFGGRPIPPRQPQGDPHPADAAEAKAGGGRREPDLHLRRAEGGGTGWRMGRRRDRGVVAHSSSRNLAFFKL